MAVHSGQMEIIAIAVLTTMNHMRLEALGSNGYVLIGNWLSA